MAAAGIATALAGTISLFLQNFAPAVAPLLLLAIAYSWQACGELLLVPNHARRTMLHDERLVPMAIASIGLMMLFS